MNNTNISLTHNQMFNLSMIAIECNMTVEEIANNIIAEYIAMYINQSVEPHFTKEK